MPDHMSALARAVLDRYKTCRILVKGGASLRGIMLYPLRHRLPAPLHQIDLKTGLSIVSPMEEPLVHIFEDIWLNQCYTPGDFKIDPGDTVVDIGANLGIFSVWAATRAKGVRVISLEPSPRMFRFLLQNLSRNGLRQVVAVQAACGGETGTAVLYSYGFEEGNSLYPRNIRGKVFRPQDQVEVLTLDDVFRRHEVEVCNLLKLNCEGGEYEILLKASKETLRRVRKMSMVYHLGLHDHGPEEMVGFLRQHGFEVTYSPPYDELGGYLYARRHV
jgi:FkbM family methyltransferase